MWKWIAKDDKAPQAWSIYQEPLSIPKGDGILLVIAHRIGYKGSEERRYPASANNHGSMKSWLDVDAPGQRVLQISMREDGAELDKIVLTLDENYIPEGDGPVPKLFKGQLPPAFKGVETQP